MEQTLISAFRQKDYQIIREVLLNKTQFLEMQYAIGQESFRQLVSLFEVINVRSQEMIEMMTTNLYYFVTEQWIEMKIQNKQQKGKSKKLIGLKKSGNNGGTRRSLNTTQVLPKNYVSKIQDFVDCFRKSIGFCYGSLESNTLLRLNANLVDVQVMNKMRMNSVQKLKFLGKLDIFEQVPRHILNENLQRFNFTRLSFNSIVYSSRIRDESTIIMLKGQVMIEYKKISKGIIVRSPNILKYDKQNQQQNVKCLTQSMLCYVISNNDLDDIFKRKAKQQDKQYDGFGRIQCSYLRAKYFDKQNLFGNENFGAKSGKNSFYQGDGLDVEQKIKNRLHRNDLLENGKKQRIKQHFSNFMSEKYNNQIGKGQIVRVQKGPQPILFKIQSRTSKQPNYKDMKCTLRDIRMNKILLLKQTYSKSNSSQKILRLQTEAQQESNSRSKAILTKIQKSINMKIQKIQEKRTGIKRRQRG